MIDISVRQAVLKRNSDLTPSTHEQSSVLSLVSKIQAILDNLVVSPGSFEAAVGWLLTLCWVGSTLVCMPLWAENLCARVKLRHCVCVSVCVGVCEFLLYVCV